MSVGSSLRNEVVAGDKKVWLVQKEVAGMVRKNVHPLQQRTKCGMMSALFLHFLGDERTRKSS